MLSRSGHQKRDQKHKRNNCERCQAADDAEQTGLYWAVVSEGRGRG